MVSDGTLTHDEATPRRYDGLGGLHALRLFVSSHQEEALRVAYLLTGDAEHAGQLAEKAFHAQLGTVTHTDSERDLREDLLHSLGNFYLHAAPPVAAPIARVQGEAGRYWVDDERSRLFDALDRCERSQRLALVLRDVSRLDEETIAGLLRVTPHELRGRLEPARRRLRDAAGARPEQTVQTLLVMLALGAPRLDLWSRLAEPARRYVERERRRRRLLNGGVLAAVVLLVAVGMAWLAVGRLGSNDAAQAALATEAPRASATPLPAFTPHPLPPPLAGLPKRPVAQIPDLQLFGYLEEDGNERPRSTALIYEPPTGEHLALESLTQGVRLSPDGRWLVFTTTAADGLTSLGVIEAATQLRLWSRDAPHLDGRPVFAQERLFVISFERAGGNAPALVALAPQDGRELGRWELPTGGYTSSWSNVGALRLFPAIDESRLYVIFEQTDERSDSGQRIILTYSLPDMTLEQAAAQDIRLERGFLRPVIDLATARPTPDGRGIYSMSYEPSAPGLRFLDFESAAFLSVELPFDTPGPNTIPDLRAVLAHDGQELYVLSGNGDVAIFDLRARRVARVFQLDPGGYALTASTATQWFYWLDYGLLSPDGTRLYLVNIWTPQAAPTDRDAVSVLWTIDVTQWRIIERWEFPGEIQALSLSADGNRLYAASAVLTGRSRRGYTYDNQLLEIDAAGGASRGLNAELALPAAPLAVWTNSLQQVYRQQYGVTPVTAGVAPGAPEAYASLPRLELHVSAPVAPAGSVLEVEARLLDPALGELLAPGAQGVRFDPAATVSIVLTRPDTGQVILIPYPVDAATHRATVRLEQPGRWRAAVIVTYADGTRWSRSWPDAVQISPALQATDGRRYIFELAVEPGEPVAGAETRFRATLVDIETDAPLPQRVQLSAGVPEVVELVLYKVDGAFTSVTLLPASHGVYEARSVIQWPGSWQAALSFRVPGATAVTLSAGVLEVSAAPN